MESRTRDFDHEPCAVLGAAMERLSAEAAFLLPKTGELEDLMARAARLRDKGFGDVITYSRKVFIPLTQLS